MLEPALPVVENPDHAQLLSSENPALAASIQGFIHLLAEGDLVVLATVRPYTDAAAPYTTAWFDMFRIDDGLLVEHWDTATLPAP